MTLDIMLPYYGDVSLMQAAVRSVLAQTDPNWRLTVVDDSQEPGVPDWFAGLGDDRVRYFRNPRNLGITGNFRRCVELADYAHLTMMGADDIMLPNYVATIRSALAEYPAVAMVQPGVQIINGKGEPSTSLADQAKKHLYAPKVTARRLLDGEKLATSLLRGNWLYFPSICWRTDAVRRVNFRAHLSVIQDLALIIDLVRLGEQLVVDPTRCFQYRRHEVSLSSVSALAGSRFEEARAYFVDTSEQLRKDGWPRAARAARRYLSSRLHAVTMLPAAVRMRQKAAVVSLARHAFGPAR
jgi:glycosyltransferase involved in cell wall biosynthesis